MIGNSTIEEASEIIELLGIAHYELDNPKRYSQLQTIASYFKGAPDLRSKILQIISKGHGQDKLDMVWSYVELQNEKARTISQLTPQDFAEDIEQQLRDGVLTQENISRIKKDIEIQERNLAKEIRSQETVDMQDAQAVSALLAKPKPLDILTKTKKLLSEVEAVNKELSFYE